MRFVLAQLLLAEAAGLAVIAPLAGVFTALRVRSWCAGLTAESPVSRVLVSAGWLVRGLIPWVTAPIAASLLIALAIDRSIETATLLWFHAVLWTAAMALAMLGAACVSTFRESLDGAACAMAIALLATVGVFVAGPPLDNMPGRLLDAVLIASPVVATAASANIDLFRMHPLYQLSPLAHRQIEYPAAATALATYAAIAAVLLLIAAYRSSARGSALPVERTST